MLGPAGAAWARLAHSPVRAVAHAAHRQLRNKIRAAPHVANSSNRREQTVKRVTSHEIFLEKNPSKYLKIYFFNDIFSVKIQNDTNIIEFDV